MELRRQPANNNAKEDLPLHQTSVCHKSAKRGRPQANYSLERSFSDFYKAVLNLSIDLSKHNIQRSCKEKASQNYLQN